MSRREERVKVGLSLSATATKMVEAMATAEGREKSAVVEEAISRLFREKVKEYSETTTAFLKEKFPELFGGEKP